MCFSFDAPSVWAATAYPDRCVNVIPSTELLLKLLQKKWQLWTAIDRAYVVQQNLSLETLYIAVNWSHIYKQKVPATSLVCHAHGRNFSNK